MSRIEDIQARVDVATAGPWRKGWPSFYCTLDHQHGGRKCVYQFHGWNENEHEIFQDGLADGDVGSGVKIAGNYDYEEGGIVKSDDADFIAHAREDMPWLLARVRSLEASLAWYADLDNYLGHDPATQNDLGARARTALAGES
jgi:hypothetical protein